MAKTIEDCRRAFGPASGMTMPETPLQQAERHVVSFERIVASQEEIVARMEGIGDMQGVALSRELLAQFRHSLLLALDHRDRLLRLSGPPIGEAARLTRG